MQRFREWRHPLRKSLLYREESTLERHKLLDDAWENVGAPSSQHRQRRSPERYTRYMALMDACVVIESSSF